MNTDLPFYVKMNKYIGKRFRTFSLVILSFILGCTFTLGIIPLDKTCQVEDTDTESNIMKNSKFQNPELIIIILSAPTNYEKRNVLRQTWLNLEPGFEMSYKFKHYFVIGTFSLSPNVTKIINTEQAQHSDVLLVPTIDSYETLTDKVKLSFQWLDIQYDYGLKFKYVLKCDDDSFVNLNKLLSNLMDVEKNLLNLKQIDLSVSLPSRHHSFGIYSTNLQNRGLAKENVSLYWGYFHGNAQIKTKGKWQENSWIACDRYVPYALGGGYVLSKELVSYIGKNANLLKSFKSEDISVGFWLSPLNNVYRIHDTRFDTEWISRGCQNNHLITHNISIAEMRQLYKNLVLKGKMCSKETVKRQSYAYNWKLPPSQCCNLKFPLKFP